MRNAWEIYPNLCRAVRETHRHVGTEGSDHNFDHDLRAAQYALLIAEDDESGKLGAAAALCHSADRIVQVLFDLGYNDNAPKDQVLILLFNWLNTGPFADQEKEEIVYAVLHHTGPNRTEDSMTLTILKDADRLTCTDAENVMSAVRYFRDLPLVDPVQLLSDSGATYRNPKSVLRSFLDKYDWIGDGPFAVRLPKAKKLMADRLNFFGGFMETVIRQRTELSLTPYPF